MKNATVYSIGITLMLLLSCLPSQAQNRQNIDRISMTPVKGLFLGLDDVLFCIDENDMILRWNNETGTFDALSSKAKKKDKTSSIYSPSITSGDLTIKVNSKPVKMAVANINVYIILDHHGNVIEKWRNKSQILNGQALDIAGGLDNYFYKIDKDNNKIYRRGCSLSVDDKWHLFRSQPPVTPVGIAVSKNGNPWVVDDKGQVYNHWKGKWSHKKGITCTHLCIDKKNQVFAYSPKGFGSDNSPSKISQYNFKTKKWDTKTIRTTAMTSNGDRIYFSSGIKGVSVWNMKPKYLFNPNLNLSMSIKAPVLKQYHDLNEFSTKKSTEPTTINLENSPTSVDFAVTLPEFKTVDQYICQISTKPFNSENTRAEVSGLVDQKIIKANQGYGDFNINFLNYKYQMPEKGKPFYVRVIPTRSSDGKHMAPASNTIKVYWKAEKPKDFNFIPTKEWQDATKSTPHTPKPKGRDVQILISDLSCIKANEYEKSDISISANSGPGDEPYYVGFSFKGTIPTLDINEVHPFYKKFINVKPGYSAQHPFPVIDHQIYPAESGKWHYLKEGEFIGFGLQLWEWDEGDASERYADFNTMAGIASVAASAIITKGATLKNPGLMQSTFNKGASTMESLWDLLEEIDGDDLIDSTGILFDLPMLKEAYWEWYQDCLKAARGGHQNEILYPQLKPIYQEYAQIEYWLWLEGEDAEYSLKITIKTPNPSYIGPYPDD